MTSVGKGEMFEGDVSDMHGKNIQLSMGGQVRTPIGMSRDSFGMLGNPHLLSFGTPENPFGHN